jgi:hypothetical protein
LVVRNHRLDNADVADVAKVADVAELPVGESKTKGYQNWDATAQRGGGAGETQTAAREGQPPPPPPLTSTGLVQGYQNWDATKPSNVSTSTAVASVVGAGATVANDDDMVYGGSDAAGDATEGDVIYKSQRGSDAPGKPVIKGYTKVEKGGMGRPQECQECHESKFDGEVDQSVSLWCVLGRVGGRGQVSCHFRVVGFLLRIVEFD